MSERESRVWKRLIEQIARISSPQKVEDAIAIFTTAYERKQISKRAAALELLKGGKSYNQISRELWLSPTIINALKKSVESGGGYVSGHERAKRAGKRKIWSSFPKPPSRLDPKKYILPHGKLVYPQKRRR